MFSPVSIYFAIWGFVLFIYSLKLLDYGSLSPSFYLGLALNFIFLFIGGVIAKTFMKKSWRKEYSQTYALAFVNEMITREKKLMSAYKILLVVGFIGLIFIYLTVFSQISIPNFFLQQATVKAHVARSIIGNYLTSASFIALPIAVVLVSVNKKNKMLILFPLIQCMLYSMSFWGRVPLMTAFIMLISSMILTRQVINISQNKSIKINFIKVLMNGLLIFVVVYAFLSWTIEKRMAEFGDAYEPYRMYSNHNDLNYFLAGNLPEKGITYRGVVTTYSYLTASIPTLNYWISQESELAMGQASFPYFARLLQKVGFIQGELITGDRPLKNGLQLPTLIGYAYIDYGHIGIIIFSIIIGFIGNYLYLRHLRKPRLKFILYLSNIYVLILLSPFINATSWTSFVIIFAGFIVVNLYLAKPIKKYRNKTLHWKTTR